MMSVPDWHVCLVSAQPMANLVPLLSEQSRPRAVLMVVTPQMKQEAKALEDVVRPAGIAVEHLNVDGPLLRPLTEALVDWLSRQEEAHIWLNATGGNKPMSLAAVNAFGIAGREKHVFYVHQDSGLFEWLDTGIGDDAQAIPMSARPTLGQFLTAHGYGVISRQPANLRAGEADMLDRLADMSRSHGQALGTLNYHVHQALERRKATDTGPIIFPMPIEARGMLDRVLDPFIDLGVLRVDAGNVHVANEHDALYVGGVWFERWVGSKLVSLAGEFGLRDVATSVRVETHGGVRNELDAVAMRGSRLLVIECKTRADRADGRMAEQALNKLDMLGRLGGRMNMRSMLVSYRDLNDAAKRRAAELGIRVVDPSSLLQIQNTLRRWIRDETVEP